MSKQSKTLDTGPYKGTRDFYPEDMAIQRYIFDTWSQVAESFGFEKYDASVLEPAQLYKSKGAENEELVNEQTYTFTDRGDREVTLRPEMTPTVARMVAGKRRELTFPLRWYSIPNLFRYERPQRGRVREHWQLNCDIFGAEHYAADVEIVSLAHSVLLAFGATPEQFTIKVNHRSAFNAHLAKFGIVEEADIRAVTAVVDRKSKMDESTFSTKLAAVAGKEFSLPETVPAEISDILDALKALGIVNASYDPGIVRGFNYYTGTVFEIFDTSGDNPRSLLGGGRYDNHTELFGDEPISGVGFGMGDVTMRDFLETHNLLTANITAPTLMIIPAEPEQNIAAEKLAAAFRDTGMSVAVDIGTKKIGKKIASAGDLFVEYALVFGEDEEKSGTLMIKNLADGTEQSGTLEELLTNFN